MTTIMINKVSHRDACLDGCVLSVDAETYDLEIERYFDFVRDRATIDGFKFETRNEIGPASYTVLDEDSPESRDDAHRLMQTIASFWEWL